MRFQKNNIKNRTWVEISKNNLVHNFRVFRRISRPQTKMMSVVKANAYGHRIDLVVPILDTLGTDWFGVDSLEEALLIRKLGIKKPILVLGFIPLSNIKHAIENDISFVVYRKDILKKIVSLKLNIKAKVHLKLETGLNRQGVEVKEALGLVAQMNKFTDYIILEGLSTHFADIEDTLDSSYAMKQLKKFRESSSEIKKEIGHKLIIHCAASAAAILYDKTHINMIRVGIGLYGLWPSKETKIAMKLIKKKTKIKLKPVLTLKSTISQIKIIKTGESVGYGRTWYAPKETKIGIVPLGYYDGFDRKLSNNSRVIVRGQHCAQIGRVAMNMIVIDLTNLKGVREGDEVILIGESGGVCVSADEMADRIGTINYEIVTKINPLIPRIII